MISQNEYRIIVILSGITSAWNFQKMGLPRSCTKPLKGLLHGMGN